VAQVAELQAAMTAALKWKPIDYDNEDVHCQYYRGAKISVNGEWMYINGHDDNLFPHRVKVSLPADVRLCRMETKEAASHD